MAHQTAGRLQVERRRQVVVEFVVNLDAAPLSVADQIETLRGAFVAIHPPTNHFETQGFSLSRCSLRNFANFGEITIWTYGWYLFLC